MADLAPVKVGNALYVTTRRTSEGNGRNEASLAGPIAGDNPKRVIKSPGYRENNHDIDY